MQTSSIAISTSILLSLIHSIRPGMRSRDVHHRIIFVAMMNELEVTDKPHRNDDSRFQQAQDVRDNAARFWPGYWIIVGPGSEKAWEVR